MGESWAETDSVLIETGKGKVFEEWPGEASVFAFEIFPRSSERLCPKNTAGALHMDGGGCTLSGGSEVKMEIPANIKIESRSENLLTVDVHAGEAHILGWWG
jgi:hypothetical protein